MIRTLFFIILCNFLFNATSFAQEVGIDNKNVLLAYGFCFGQQYGLQIIKKKYPDLHLSIVKAQSIFESSDLGEGCAGVNKLISSNVTNKDLLELQNAMKQKFSKEINYTREDAVNLISDIELRAKGEEIPENILKILLSLNENFIEHPELEFKHGWRQTFNTKKHKKALGLDIDISVPLSWNAKEGKRPHVVQNFLRKVNEGQIMALLMIRDMGILTPSLQEELLDEKNIKDFLPVGTNLVSTKKIVLENIPGVQIDFDMERERLDLKLKLRFSMYVLIYKNYMIFIQGGTLVDDTTKNSLEKVHNKYSAVYKLIANSFILNNMYQ